MDREWLWTEVVAHRDRLLRLSRGRAVTTEDAEDCVQDALLRCLEFPDLDPARLPQFLTSVTLRLCVDQHRRQATDRRIAERLGARQRDEPGPEEAVCDREEAEWVARTFATLPPRQQEVMLARLDGLSCAEVARRFRTTYASVESSLARTRATLRTAFAMRSVAR